MLNGGGGHNSPDQFASEITVIQWTQECQHVSDNSDPGPGIMCLGSGSVCSLEY